MSSFSIKEIREGLDAWFSGQTELKRMLSVLGHMQSQKIRSSRLAPDRQIELPRPVLFITGSTGSGKTFCVKNFARCLGLPFKRINASQLSQAGWAGVDLQEEIKDFSDRNKGNEYAEYGVIFIDEVDKLSNRLHSSGGGDVSMAIQTSLLDILEGESIVSDTKLGGVETIKTKNYMVILGGSFEEPRRAVKNSKTIGFHDAEEQSQHGGAAI